MFLRPISNNFLRLHLVTKPHTPFLLRHEITFIIIVILLAKVVSTELTFVLISLFFTLKPGEYILIYLDHIQICENGYQQGGFTGYMDSVLLYFHSRHTQAEAGPEHLWWEINVSVYDGANREAASCSNPRLEPAPRFLPDPGTSKDFTNDILPLQCPGNVTKGARGYALENSNFGH